MGVRIPTFGCFDVVQTEILVGNKTVILQRPMFHLARNIGEGQNLENKDDLTGKAEDLTLQAWGWSRVSHYISESISWETPLAKPWGSASIRDFPGDKKLEPLKYARVAMETSVSRRKVESCILGTTSLLHHCLDNGMNVAFILNDVGVLLIKGSTVQMRFYLDFLEKVMGHRIQDRATLKALHQLDMVVSRQAPITSLSSAGRVVIFPNFEQTFPSMSLSRDHLKGFGFVPGEDKRDITGLPPIRRGREGTLPGLPVPAHQGSSAKAGEQPWDGEEMETRQSSRVRDKPQSRVTKRQHKTRGAEEEEEKEKIREREREKRKFSLEKKEKEGKLLEEKGKKLLLEEKEKNLVLEEKEKEGKLLEEKEKKLLLEEKEKEENLLEEKKKKLVLGEMEKKKFSLEKKEKKGKLLEEKEEKLVLREMEKRKFSLEKKEKEGNLLEEKEKKLLLEEKERKLILGEMEKRKFSLEKKEIEGNLLEEKKKKLVLGEMEKRKFSSGKKEKEGNVLEEKEKKLVSGEMQKRKFSLEKEEKKGKLLEEKKKLVLGEMEKRKFSLEKKEKEGNLLEEKNKKLVLGEMEKKFNSGKKEKEGELLEEKEKEEIL
ncbi:hypothetical protein TURU_092288 [Turdus rufiventris]|nr:hypothetical protein TURU_092288 [Turdus rufiventris]